MRSDRARPSPVVRFRSLANSVSARLFLRLFPLIVIAFGAYALLTVRSTSREWEQNAHLWAQQFSDLIKQSTQLDMLVNNKEHVHEIIRAIAEEPGVEGVRVYDKNGTIIFAADSDEIGTQVDLRAEACISCHQRDEPLRAVPVASRTRIFQGVQGDRILGLISPIENRRECSDAACHAHPRDQSILGVLDVRMSLAQADAQLAATTRNTVVAGLLTALAAGILAALFILRVVRRPVLELANGAEQVASGKLDTEIVVKGRGEISQLASAFNSMTRDLRKARQELTEWSSRLEQKLKEKTAELIQTQRQVVQMEKMASLGKLAATVAHELNNPLAGILNYAKLVQRTIEETNTPFAERVEVARYLNLVQKEAGRSGTIVRNLLTFARQSGSEFALHHLNPILDRSVMLLRHHLEISEVRLETKPCEGNDEMVCDADQVQQALVALLVNAVEAMPVGGVIHLEAEGNKEWIELAVSDTGVGIPDDAIPHIFEPFFSSKEDTGGAGLGLSVVYGIVQRHGGTINVESEVNHGTTFRLRLPRKPRVPSDARGGGKELAAAGRPNP